MSLVFGDHLYPKTLLVPFTPMPYPSSNLAVHLYPETLLVPFTPGHIPPVT